MIGGLDKRITLQRPIKEDDGQGGRKPRHVDHATVWAEFLRPKHSMNSEGGGIVSEENREIKIRTRTDVRKGWKVTHGTRTFDVQHTFEIGREWTVMVCKDVTR